MSETSDATSTAIAAALPSPGSSTVAQQSASSSAKPTGGASHDQLRLPQSAMAACPISSEAMQTARVVAYVPSTRRP
jgi:hypothetical protein